jgi:hypothetical protein
MEPKDFGGFRGLELHNLHFPVVLEDSEEMTLVFQPDHVVDKVFKVVWRLLSVGVDLRWEIKIFNEL